MHPIVLRRSTPLHRACATASYFEFAITAALPPHGGLPSPSPRRRLTRPTSADRLCCVRTASLVTTDRARALQVRDRSPPLYFEVLLFLTVFPASVSTALGTHTRLSGKVIRADRDRCSIHLVDRRATIDDPRLHGCEDVDQKVSQIVTTQRTHLPELRDEVRGGSLLGILGKHLVTLDSLRSSPLDSP